MNPIIVLIGRPNVGKSTLFNRLTRSRDALVADFPGLTRDRHYGTGHFNGRNFLVVDTGGLVPNAKDEMFFKMAQQTEAALAEADVVLFLTDAREGLTAHDQRIAEQLRRSGRPVTLVVNKVEGIKADIASAEFHELGFGMPISISAAHGQGVGDLLAQILAAYPEQIDKQIEEVEKPKIAVVGRPNVGKSTLINAILGEDRMIAHDAPGTTRDSIQVDFRLDDKEYVLIDTAGIRRRGKVFETIEKFSVIKTLQSIEQANVVILMIDGSDEISEQDAHLAGFVLEQGRALVVAVNKWDAADEYRKELTKRAVARKLKFLSYSKFHYISARTRQGVGPLLASAQRAYDAAMCRLSTPRLTRVLQDAISRQQPPRSGTGRPKMRYAHQGGKNPPLIIIHGAALQSVPASYKRYLEASFREAFRIEGTPLRVEFRTNRNPYVVSDAT